MKIIQIIDFKIIFVGQNTVKSIHYVSSQSSVITGRDYAVSENMTANKEVNTMHSTTKVVSSMGTITKGQNSLTEYLHGELTTPHVIRFIKFDTDNTEWNIY